MKKSSILMVLVICLVALVGCAEEKPAASTTVVSQEVSYEDGTYRGTFSDRNNMNVGVQFILENNKVTEITFRHLWYKDVDYRDEETDKTIIGLRKQHEELIEYLIGKDIRESIKDLHTPEEIVKEQVDGFTAATLRVGKLTSAINDGLNRGVYSYK